MNNKINFFCPLPWISLNTRVNGESSICCEFDNVKFDNQFILNLELDNSKTLSELRNSEIFKETRKSILNNKIPIGCQKCYNNQLQGIISKRQIEEKLWQDYISEEKILENTYEDGTISTEHIPLLNFDIVLGNKCNLKCRMCRPELSYNLFDEHKKLFGDIMLQNNMYVKKKNKVDIKFDWSNKYKWEEKLQNEKIITYRFSGGEPLIFKSHYRIIKYLVKTKMANNIKLVYNTNFLFLPNKLTLLWKEFREIVLLISIDGIKKEMEYIRGGYDWEKLVLNLQKIDKAKGNFNIQIMPTIQILNILTIQNLIIWELDQKFKRISKFRSKPFLPPNLLYYPDYLDIRLLPNDYKIEVHQNFEKLTKHIETRKDFTKEMYSNFEMFKEQILHYLDSDKQRPIDINEFISITKKVDSYRNQDIKKHIIKLNGLFE